MSLSIVIEFLNLVTAAKLKKTNLMRKLDLKRRKPDSSSLNQLFNETKNTYKI